MHRLTGEVAIDPALHGRPGHLETGGDLADRPPLLYDETGNLEAVSWGERGIGVCHEIFREWKRASRFGWPSSGLCAVQLAGEVAAVARMWARSPGRLHMGQCPVGRSMRSTWSRFDTSANMG